MMVKGARGAWEGGLMAGRGARVRRHRASRGAASAPRAAGPAGHLPVTPLTQQSALPTIRQSGTPVQLGGGIIGCGQMAEMARVCHPRGEGVEGREGPLPLPPSPDSRHPLSWRIRLPAPAISGPFPSQGKPQLPLPPAGVMATVSQGTSAV